MKILKILYTISATLLLSLSASEMLGAEAAKQQGAKESNFTLIDFSHRPYLPELTLSGFYGSKKSSYGGLDILYPIYQRPDRIVFLDLRGVLHNSPNKEVNLGGGYRWLSDDASKLYGAYIFYDRKMSPYKNWFEQVTLGGELKTAQLSFGANVYLPVGTRSVVISRTAHSAEAKAYEGNKFTIDYTDNVIREYAMQGIDAEVAYTWAGVKGLRAYTGIYMFNNNDVDSLSGPRVGLIYDIASLVKRHLPSISRLELETSLQHDNSRSTIWYAGVRMSIPLGSEKGRPQLKGLEKAMTRFVRRDVDIVVNTDDTLEVQQFNKPDGTPYVGQIVTKQSELTKVTTHKSGIDIIGVKNRFTVTGDTYGDEHTKAAVNLLEGQSITGLGLTFDVEGRTYHADIVNSANGITNADPTSSRIGGLTLDGTNGTRGHLLHPYSTNASSVDQTIVQRIEDLVLTVPEAAASTEQKSAVISNTTGQLGDGYDSNGDATQNHKYSFGKLVIDNITANSIIYLDTAANKSGSVTVQDSTMTVVNPKKFYNNTAYGVITVKSVAESDIKIVAIRNNDISVSSDVGPVTGVRLSYLNGPLSGNRFGDIETTVGIYTHGIRLANALSGTITGNSFDAITGSTTGYAYGILGVGDDTNGSMASGSAIRDNHFKGTISAMYARGMYFSRGMNTDSVIEKNSFQAITGGPTGSAYGILSEGDNTTGSMKSGSAIRDNHFKGTISASTAAGIQLNNFLSGTINDNTFDAITGESGGTANGIRVVGDDTNGSMASGSAISGNRFKGTISAGSAYGIELQKSLSGTINDNTFDAITGESGGTASGIRVVGDDTNGSMASGSVISGNRFEGTIAAEYARGILLDKPLSGTIGCTTVSTTGCGNVFQAIEGTTNAYGILVNANDANVGMAEDSVISGNHFEGTISAGSIASGIQLEASLSGTISDNSFKTITGGSAGYAYGISVLNNSITGDMKNSSSISDNHFKGTISAKNAYGINLNNLLSGTIKDNTFAAISATGSGVGDAYGILTNSIGTNGTISGNKFNGEISAKNAYGIALNNLLSGTIKDNTFAAISAIGTGTGNSDATGIQADSIGTNGTISGNKFNGEISSVNDDAWGVKVGDSSNDMKGTIKDNTFDAITTTGDDVWGIYAWTVSGTIDSNTFYTISTTGTGNGNSARGIHLLSVDSSGVISSNKFNSAITSQNGMAGGLEIHKGMSGKIKGNSIIVSGKVDALGIGQNLDSTFIAANVTGNTLIVSVTEGSGAYGFSLPAGTATSISNTLKSSDNIFKDAGGNSLGDANKVLIR